MASSEAIIRAATSVAAELKVITKVGRLPFYNDEPKLFQYAAEYLVGPASKSRTSELSYGTDIEREPALVKCLCEAIERHSLSVQECKLVRGCSVELGEAAIDLRKLKFFDCSQLARQTYSQFRFGQNTIFDWVSGRDLLRDREVLIPAQLVFLPYHSRAERIIRLPDSTGAACECVEQAAIGRGIFEVLERDAFMCWYLAPLQAVILSLTDSKNQRLRNLNDSFRRYSLELIILKLPTDLPFPIIMAVIIDRSGIGPAVTVGLKAHFNLAEAILGAVAEAHQPRPWARDVLSDRKLYSRRLEGNISTFEQRALFWADTRKISLLLKLWQGAKQQHVDALLKSDQQTINWVAAASLALEKARSLSLDVYSVNVTPKRIAEKGFVVIRVIIPQAQPVYFNEAYPYLGSLRLQAMLAAKGSRWPKMASKNRRKILPHPFL